MCVSVCVLKHLSCVRTKINILIRKALVSSSLYFTGDNRAVSWSNKRFRQGGKGFSFDIPPLLLLYFWLDFGCIWERSFLHPWSSPFSHGYQRWEFIKEIKKLRKQENKNSTKKKEKILNFFLGHFLGRVLVFFLFFFFSCFLTFLFSVINSHLMMV